MISPARTEQFHRAFDVLRSGINQRAFPGAAVAVTYRESSLP